MLITLLILVDSWPGSFWGLFCWQGHNSVGWNAASCPILISLPSTNHTNMSCGLWHSSCCLSGKSDNSHRQLGIYLMPLWLYQCLHMYSVKICMVLNLHWTSSRPSYMIQSRANGRHEMSLIPRTWVAGSRFRWWCSSRARMGTTAATGATTWTACRRRGGSAIPRRFLLPVFDENT